VGTEFSKEPPDQERCSNDLHRFDVASETAVVVGPLLPLIALALLGLVAIRRRR